MLMEPDVQTAPEESKTHIRPLVEKAPATHDERIDHMELPPAFEVVAEVGREKPEIGVAVAGVGVKAEVGAGSQSAYQENLTSSPYS